MGMISIRRIILDNIDSREEAEVRSIALRVCNLYNVPFDSHIENIIRDIVNSGNKVNTKNIFDNKKYTVNEISNKIGVSPKQIRRKLRKIYGKCNDRWIITEDMLKEILNHYNK